jgi:hypothetical protein
MSRTIPVHQGLERVVLISLLIKRMFRAVAGSLAISQKPH